MSGGSHDYSYFYLDSYITSMKRYDSELAEMLEDVRELCRDVEWYESGDTSDISESIKNFKKKWISATPELQQKVKKAILDYCDTMDKYSTKLRQQMESK